MLEIGAAAVLGSLLFGGSLAQSITAGINAKREQETADKQLELQQKQFDAEMEASQAEAQKEANTTANNNQSLENVFGTPKKRKQTNEIYFGDLNGVV